MKMPSPAVLVAVSAVFFASGGMTLASAGKAPAVSHAAARAAKKPASHLHSVKISQGTSSRLIYGGSGFGIYASCSSNGDIGVAIFNHDNHAVVSESITDVGSGTVGNDTNTNWQQSKPPADFQRGWAPFAAGAGSYLGEIVYKTPRGNATFMRLFATGAPSATQGVNGSSDCYASVDVG